MSGCCFYITCVTLGLIVCAQSSAPKGANVAVAACRSVDVAVGKGSCSPGHDVARVLNAGSTSDAEDDYEGSFLLSLRIDKKERPPIADKGGGLRPGFFTQSLAEDMSDGFSLLMTLSTAPMSTEGDTLLILIMLVCVVLMASIFATIFYCTFLRVSHDDMPARIAEREDFRALSHSQKAPWLKNQQREIGSKGAPSTLQTAESLKPALLTPPNGFVDAPLSRRNSGIEQHTLVPVQLDGAPSIVSTPTNTSLVQQGTTLSLPEGPSSFLTAGVPPPMCPALVLTDCTTKLEILSSNLEEAKRDRHGARFNIDGPLRKALFRAAIMEVPDGLALGISIPSQGSRPWAVVQPLQEENVQMLAALLPETQTSQCASYELVDQFGVLYGFIASMNGGTRSFLVHRSSAAFSINYNRSSMELSAKVQESNIAVQLGPKRGDAKITELRISPGFDPLLLLTAALAIVIFL